MAPAGDGTYEVLDGFKRLAHWTRDGHTHVPAVVEDAAGVVAKVRLLDANAPRRTLSPMDEARVVRSLADDDRLTPALAIEILVCPRCAGPRRILRAVTEPHAVRRWLTALGLAAEPPPLPVGAPS